LIVSKTTAVIFALDPVPRCAIPTKAPIDRDVKDGSSTEWSSPSHDNNNMRPSSGKDVGRMLIVMIMSVAMIGRFCLLPAWSSDDSDNSDRSSIAATTGKDAELWPGVDLAVGILGATTTRQEEKDARRRSAKVSVQIYVESLCIDSKRYMEEQVLPAYEALGTGIMDLSIISFGNAKFNADTNDPSSLMCQHGPAECDVNSYQQCAAHVYHDNVSRYLPFLACLFERLPMGHRDEPFDSAVIAACTGSLHWPSVHQCHDDPVLAWELQTRAAAATPVEHTYVPWVVIDGQHVDETRGNLVDMVCAAYRGPTTSFCPVVASGPARWTAAQVDPPQTLVVSATTR
jgi:hypothetical protein